MHRKFLQVCNFDKDNPELNHILCAIVLRFSIQEFAIVTPKGEKLTPLAPLTLAGRRFGEKMLAT